MLVDALKHKEKRLFDAIAETRSLIVAYSGGVDSAYLAHAAHRVLGDDTVAVTAKSASYPRNHFEMAERVARECGFRHRLVETREIENPEYAANPVNRCYFCKTELFDTLEGLRSELGIEAVAYGGNADHMGD